MAEGPLLFSSAHTASADHSLATSSNLSFMDRLEARAGRSKFPSSARSGLMERKSSGNGRRPQLFFGLCAKSSDLPWPAGGHGLQPQLQAREPAAHTGTVSEQCLEPNRAKFSRQLKRISVQMDSVVRVSPPSVSNASGSLKTARHVRLCRADNLVTVSEARPPAEPAAYPSHRMDREPGAPQIGSNCWRLYRIEWLGTTGLTGRLC